MAIRRITLFFWIPLVSLCTWGGIWWQIEGTRWKPHTAPASATLVEVQTAWRQHIGVGCHVAFDPAGLYTAIVGPPGCVRFLDATGNTIGTRVVRSVDAAVLTGRGEVAALFRREDPADGRITFVHLNSPDSWEADIRAPVCDVSLSVDGQRSACAAGNGYLYSFSLENRRREGRWRSVGRPTQVYMAPDGSMVAVATADPPTVCAYTPDGRFGWKVSGKESQGKASLCPSSDGGFLACVLTFRAPHATSPSQLGEGAGATLPAEKSRLVVMSASGRQQWGALLHTSVSQVALSADGRHAAVNYAKLLKANEQATWERKVVFLESGPETRPTWQHGGPFYDPHWVAIAEDGSFVVAHDGDCRLFFFDASGQELWRHRMETPITNIWASADSKSLLVYTRDGWLTLLRISWL